LRTGSFEDGHCEKVVQGRVRKEKPNKRRWWELELQVDAQQQGGKSGDDARNEA
jgi:hypothetical protein